MSSPTSRPPLFEAPAHFPGLSPLSAVSALDGRYHAATVALAPHFSEFALIRYRVLVETRWLQALSDEITICEVRPLARGEVLTLNAVAGGFALADADRVKEIERTTNHDVKAVEYFVRDVLAQTSLEDVREWVHFACTSEDINNLAHALMLRGAVEDVFLPQARALVDAIADLAAEHADTPLLSRTHGQAASPSTVGKELAVFVARMRRALRTIEAQEYLGKFGGAVGAFNAHAVAFPDAPWEAIARRFVEGLGLTYNPLTTQIEPHDYMAELFHALIRFNSVLLDFDRDVWAYISLGYFGQRTVAGEVGSSTMPHKVNPIDFENSEANVGLANALLGHLAEKLTVSRLQRDLSDSSAIRSVGSAIAHALLAVVAAKRGLGKLTVNETALRADLNETWEVLGEAVQTVMKKAGHADAYEKLKTLTRGKGIDQTSLQDFVAGLDLPAEDKARLLALTPETYTGLAAALARAEVGKKKPPKKAQKP